jgi:hypothetical protein
MHKHMDITMYSVHTFLAGFKQFNVHVDYLFEIVHSSWKILRFLLSSYLALSPPPIDKSPSSALPHRISSLSVANKVWLF